MWKLWKHVPPLDAASLMAMAVSVAVAGGAFLSRFPDDWAFYGIVIFTTLVLLVFSFIGALELQKKETKLLNRQTYPNLEKVYRVVILTVIQAGFAVVLVWSVAQNPDSSGTGQPRSWLPGVYLMIVGGLYIIWDFFVDRCGAPKETFRRFIPLDLCIFLAGIDVLVVTEWVPGDKNISVVGGLVFFVLIAAPIVASVAGWHDKWATWACWDTLGWLQKSSSSRRNAGT